MARLREAVRESDAQALRSAAHALKGAVSNFAAPAATEAALRLQKMGEAGQLAGAGEALGRLEGEIVALLASLGAVVGPRRPSPPRKAGPGSIRGKRATPRRAPKRRR